MSANPLILVKTETLSPELKGLLEEIARSLVDLPEQVVVDQISSKQSIVLTLRVASSDVGKMIGKHGRTAQAVRVILNAVATKLQKKVILEIVE